MSSRPPLLLIGLITGLLASPAGAESGDRLDVVRDLAMRVGPVVG